MYHILNLYKRSSNEMVLNGAFEFSYGFKIMVHDSIWKFHYYMFGVYLLNFIIMYIFLFELIILIIIFYYHIDDFTIHLWQSNKIHSIKSPMWHKKWASLFCNYPTFCFLTYNKKSQRLNTRDLQSNSCYQQLIKRYQFLECSQCIKRHFGPILKYIYFILYRLFKHSQLQLG